MIIEVIAIGNEILSGAVLNSNASFISRLLNDEGYPICRHLVLQDDVTVLKEELNLALKRSDLLIVTGGLGPTLDDKTREIIVQLSKERVEIPNTIGTASGYIIKKGKTTAFFLPGVPYEMKEMFAREALPYIQSHFPLKEKLFSKELHFCLLNEVEVDPYLREMDIETGIYPSIGGLRVKLASKSEDKLTFYEKSLRERFESHVFEGDTLEEALKNELIAQDKKIAVAESCSGGLLAHKITAIEGASAYFLCSVVAYSNEAKKKFLNVSETILQKVGAVSVEVVQEMCRGLFDKFPSADYTVAISGIAGPSGGTLQKPVGTVCIAVATKGEEIKGNVFHFKGNRSTIIECAAATALGTLFRKLKYGISTDR